MFTPLFATKDGAASSASASAQFPMAAAEPAATSAAPAERSKWARLKASGGMMVSSLRGGSLFKLGAGVAGLGTSAGRSTFADRGSVATTDQRASAARAFAGAARCPVSCRQVAAARSVNARAPSGCACQLGFPLAGARRPAQRCRGPLAPHLKYG